jgi:hypothetical protein
VSPVKYELGFYMPEDDILHNQRCENLITSLRLVSVLYRRVLVEGLSAWYWTSVTWNAPPVACSSSSSATASPSLTSKQARHFFRGQKRETKAQRYNLVIYSPCENNTIKKLYLQLRKRSGALWAGERRRATVSRHVI